MASKTKKEEKSPKDNEVIIFNGNSIEYNCGNQTFQTTRHLQIDELHTLE